MDGLRIRVGFAACALLATLACGADTMAPGPDFTGRWTGSVCGAAFDITLTDAGGRIHGDGTVVTNTVIFITVSGTHSHPAFHLALTNPQYITSYIDGVDTSGTAIVGRISGSGFYDVLVLTRASSPSAPAGR